MHFFYNLAIHFYRFGIRLATFFHPKAKRWIDGRKGIFEKLELWKSAQTPETNGTTAPTIWVHAASLGEYEQGRPVMEKIREKLPAAKIVLTFFSPSGYEIRKNDPLADLVTYLPADTATNAKRFIGAIAPDLVIFIKYEFWYNYLLQLQAKRTPTLLISALFRPEQYFFRWYGQWFRQILRGFEHIFVQNEQSFYLLKNHQIERVSLAGDTRIDRVMDIARRRVGYEQIEQFTQNQPVLVCGSTWPEDEKLLAELIEKTEGWKFIIAPHEIDEGHLRKLETLLAGNCIRYSQTSEKSSPDKKVILIDNIGMLSSLYQYGKVAYVGGAFSKGLHNILEPAAFHLPVIFGPNYRKFTEAVSLIEKGGAFAVRDAPSLFSTFNKLKNKAFRETAAKKVKLYLSENCGASEQVTDHVLKLLKTTYD